MCASRCSTAYPDLQGKGNNVIDELWAEPPPKPRVLTRKQYVTLHEAFGKHLEGAPFAGVTVVCGQA